MLILPLILAMTPLDYLPSRPAFDCGTVTYQASGTTYIAMQPVHYTAVRVDWENGTIEVRKSDGSWVSFGNTPADPDQGLLENIVQDLVHREVSSNC